MRLEHHLVGGYVRYISPHIIILLLLLPTKKGCTGSLLRMITVLPLYGPGMVSRINTQEVNKNTALVKAKVRLTL